MDIFYRLFYGLSTKKIAKGGLFFVFGADGGGAGVSWGWGWLERVYGAL